MKIAVLYAHETLWLNPKSLAALFDVNRAVILKYLQEIFSTSELQEPSVHTTFARQAADGHTYQIHFYNLDAIIAVGYRVNAKKATPFRLWATAILRDLTTTGFVLDESELPPVQQPGKGYFEGLRARIRAIRTSERQHYQKIVAIYEECSIDYAAGAAITQDFFRTVQNKLHWAVTGKTAAQLIAERANAAVPYMGLQSWKNGPGGKIQKSDVNIAKNYLTEKEMKALKRIVTMFLYYAENQAVRQVPMKMHDWIDKLDSFLHFNQYAVLKDTGNVTPETAKQLAENAYQQFKMHCR